MNKQTFALCLFAVCAAILMPSFGQESFKADVPCTDALILSLKGKYRVRLADKGGLFHSLLAADVMQLESRLKAVQQLVEETIPPAGLEPFYKHMGGNHRFAADAQNEKGFATLHATYLNYIQYYFCGGGAPNLVSYSGETGTSLQISFNGIHAPMDFNPSDNFLVDGRPVYQSRPIIGKWKGYDLYGSCELEVCRERYVLLHRPGAKPYLPVSRRQYIDFCSALWRQRNDASIEWAKANETEKLEVAIKLKEDATNMYKEELSRNTGEGLLDTQAIIRGGGCPGVPGAPIFSTEEEGGGRLVTENQAYFRKDLPKYVPQLIWVRWAWNDSAATLNFRKVFEADFPIDKLKAMIDK